MAKKNLAPKEQRFCEEYLIDMNATQAYIRAGYAQKSARQLASRLLSKDYIQEEIARLKAERSERTKLDADYVLKSAGELHEICMAKKQIENLEKEGYVFNVAGAAKALELIGRHVGVRAFDLSEGSGTDEPVADEFL